MKYKRTVRTIKAKPRCDIHGEVAKRRTAAYIHVSTNSKEQLTSFEAQRDYFPKYIASLPTGNSSACTATRA